MEERVLKKKGRIDGFARPPALQTWAQGHAQSEAFRFFVPVDVG
jgi:hypothetical protein